MNFFRQLSVGLLTALTSSLLVLGALSLASLEGFVQSTATSTPTLTSTVGPPQPTIPGQPTATLVLTPSPVPPTQCPPPQGWTAYIIQAGDILAALSTRYNLPVEQIVRANCLISESLLPDSILYLPPLSTTTPTPTSLVEIPTEIPTITPPVPTLRQCGRPSGWVPYIVHFGDTLYSLSLAFRTTVSDLQIANCLDSPDNIKAGMTLFVPNVPTRTPMPSPTKVSPTNTSAPPTKTPTPTSTPVSPANTPTPTSTPVSPTDTPTPTHTPTPTPTPTPTDTPEPTPTHTPTPPPTATDTPTPTPTGTPTGSTDLIVAFNRT